MPWAPVQDDAGRTYWFNEETQESQWDTPAEVACAWSAALDESSGSTYYRNAVTEEVVWELPDGASLAAPAADAPAAAADAVDTWSAVLDDVSGSTYYRNDVSEEVVWELPAGAVLTDSSAPAAAPAADEWDEHFDEANGMPYFINRANGESVWERPATGVAGPAGASQSDGALPNGWTTVTDNMTGAAYYMHMNTDRWQWDVPSQAAEDLYFEEDAKAVRLQAAETQAQEKAEADARRAEAQAAAARKKAADEEAARLQASAADQEDAINVVANPTAHFEQAGAGAGAGEESEDKLASLPGQDNGVRMRRSSFAQSSLATSGVSRSARRSSVDPFGNFNSINTNQQGVMKISIKGMMGWGAPAVVHCEYNDEDGVFTYCKNKDDFLQAPHKVTTVNVRTNFERVVVDEPPPPITIAPGKKGTGKQKIKGFVKGYGAFTFTLKKGAKSKPGTFKLEPQDTDTFGHWKEAVLDEELPS